MRDSLLPSLSKYMMRERRLLTKQTKAPEPAEAEPVAETKASSVAGPSRLPAEQPSSTPLAQPAPPSRKGKERAVEPQAKPVRRKAPSLFDMAQKAIESGPEHKIPEPRKPTVF
jgi:hypothetical protein